MIDFQSKAGAINSKDIDLSKIYASKQNALDGVNNVKISDSNASWKSDNLTYVIQDDGKTVVISNGGVPIGYTTVEALNATQNPSERGFPSTRDGATTDQSLANVDYTANQDDLLGEEPTPQAEPEQTVETTYNEAPAEEIHEEHNTPINSGESDAPTEELTIEAEVSDEAALEIEAENQPTPEPPIDIESLDAEVQDEAAQEVINSGTAQPSDFNYKHEQSNILAAKARNMGFTDEQITMAIGISRWETGNYEHLAGGYNYGGVSGSGDAGSATYDGHVYAQYSSQDVGMDAFLSNLKENYFDQGYTTIEGMSRKYLGYTDDGSWARGVHGCMN